MYFSGTTLLPRLCKALGITHEGVQKLVIEVGVEDIGRVYVAGVLGCPEGALEEALSPRPDENGPEIVHVADVTVDEKGQVSPIARITRVP